jgi:Cu/Ag efflux pump CusA
VNVAVRGSAEAMNASFRSFAIGLTLSVVLLYLILVAQFRSFIDPFIILLALPPGISGVLMVLVLTGTTLNVMSLMGVVMLAGHRDVQQHSDRRIRAPPEDGRPRAWARRFRILPRAFAPHSDDIARHHHRADADGMKLGEGSESYAPLARALIGGLLVSVVFTVFLVPAGFSHTATSLTQPSNIKTP